MALMLQSNPSHTKIIALAARPLESLLLHLYKKQNLSPLANMPFVACVLATEQGWGVIRCEPRAVENCYSSKTESCFPGGLSKLFHA